MNTSLEKIAFITKNIKEINTIKKYLYIYSSKGSDWCATKVMNTIFGKEKIADIFEENKNYEYQESDLYDKTLWFTNIIKDNEGNEFFEELQKILAEKKIKNENILNKRMRKIKNIIKKIQNGKIRLYKYLYSEGYANYSLEDFKRLFRSDEQKENIKQWFLSYIQETDTIKKKQSKKYSVSRDLDKETYYVTTEGKLAKIRVSCLNKRIKNGDIEYKRANKVIEEGIIVKPMRLINKIMPKAHDNMKLYIASLFEGIKECKMIIDDNFEKAYNPYYSNHQDTDGDKASNYSCMSGEGTRAQEFYGSINGCHVVRWETDDGEQVGRCIMYEWNGRRHFIRIYGLYDYHRTMINMLEAQMKEGDIFGRNDAIEDIKLPTTMDYDTCLMYLDGNRYGLKEEREKWYMVADNYDIDSKTTGGESIDSMLEDTCTCEHCGRRYSTDDGYWVNDYFYCCTECAHEDGYYECERCGEWVHEDDAITIDGNYYCCEQCARNAGYEYDNYYNEWECADDLGATDDGKYYTARYGAAEYYGVNEEEVKWDDNKYCWKRPEQEENNEQETKEGEQNVVQEQ